jgi:Ca-activated chloride channel family protein
MHLARPEWLWLLSIVPVVLFRAALGRARRTRDWWELGQGGRPVGDGAYLAIVAIAAIVVALAQPRWGRVGPSTLPDGHDVVLAIDVSRSMGAVDAVPDRLHAATEAAASLVIALGRERGTRVAVVAFAGRGVARCPLTETLGAPLEVLSKLHPGDVTPGGTDLGAALEAARDAFDDQDRAGGRTIVIFSDGEDHANRWRASVDRLRGEGVLVHAVAVGDASAGHPVPSGRTGDSEPLKYQGSIVLSRRSDEALETIARETGGAFVPLGLATTDLGRLFQARIEPVARERRRTIAAPAPAERFGVFLLAGVAFTLAASWHGRVLPRRLGWAWGAAVAVCITFAGFSLGAGANDVSPAALVAAGRSAYSEGRLEEALGLFRRAAAGAPRSPVPRYDAAATLFQLGRFEEALLLYGEVRLIADPSLQTKIDFAMGNTAAALGALGEAIAHYDDCIASTAKGAELDRVRSDAAINRQFLEEQAGRSVSAEGGDEPSRQRPDSKGSRRPSELGANPPEPNEQGISPKNPGEAPPEPAPESSPDGRRGAGGAGGSGPAPPRPGSPEDQLAKAIENVRESLHRRLADEPQADDQEGRKDW